MNELEDRLKTLDIEDFIWVIYLVIIGLCFLSNRYERDFLINNNNKSKKTYRNIVIVIFSTALIIYAYYFYQNFGDVRNLSDYDSKKKKILNYSSLVGSSLVLISGIIFLCVAFFDTDLETEIAFN